MCQQERQAFVGKDRYHSPFHRRGYKRRTMTAYLICEAEIFQRCAFTARKRIDAGTRLRRWNGLNLPKGFMQKTRWPLQHMRPRGRTRNS